MYRKNKEETKTFKINTSYKGETIEQKIARITTNKEPIKDGAPLIYTERKEGVRAEYDIRTDRFEIAVEAMDAVTKANRAKREHKPINPEEANENMKIEDKKTDSGTESVQATGNKE